MSDNQEPFVPPRLNSNDERNPFLAAADAFMPAPLKRAAAVKARAFDRKQAANLKEPGAAEKKIREQSRLTAGYRRAQRRHWREALTGPHGTDLLALRRRLRRFGPGDGASMLAYVRAEAARWIVGADAHTRRLAWGVVSARTQKIRSDLGLTPIDDPIPPLVPGDPGQPPQIDSLCFAAILPELSYPVEGNSWGLAVGG